jgi:hypothetical protein
MNKIIIIVNKDKTPMTLIVKILQALLYYKQYYIKHYKNFIT